MSKPLYVCSRCKEEREERDRESDGKKYEKECDNKLHVESAFSGETQLDCWELKVTAWEAVKEGAAEGVWPIQ